MLFLEKVRRRVFRLRRFKVIATLTLLLLILAMLLFSLSVAQPFMEWSRTYGGTDPDVLNTVIRTSDGGYAVLGRLNYSSFFDPGGYNPGEQWFFTTDANGYMQWNNNLGGMSLLSSFIFQTADDEFLFLQDIGSNMNFIKINSAGAVIMNQTVPELESVSMIQTSDGGYALVGQRGNQSLFQKYDDELILQRETNISSEDTGSFSTSSLVEVSDGGYAFIKSRFSFTPVSSYSLSLIKISSFGYYQWSIDNDTDTEYWLSFIQTSDNGFVIIGVDGVYSPDYDLLLKKIDSSGNMLWSRTYGGTENDLGYSVVETSDGGYVVLGNTYSFGAGINDAWLFKTDANGNMLWNQTYGGTESDYATQIFQARDGGYIMLGNTYSFGAGIDDVWLFKTDANGNVHWNQTYGGPGSDYASYIFPANDGEYVLAGTTNSSGAGGKDIWLFKVVSPPLTASATPSSATVTRGQQATFSVNASGTPPYTYQWYDDTSAMAGQTSSQLTVTKSTTGTYSYYCNVTDSGGRTVNSNTVTLTVTSPPSNNGDDGDTTPPPEDGGDGGTTPPPQDTTPPTGSISINNGASTTNTTTITLNLQATDSSGVAEMRFSNDNVTWSDWQTYSTSASWTLTEGDGTKTVYVQFKDNAGLISTYSRTITLATQPDLPDESTAFPVENVIIIVAVVVVIAVVAFIIYKLLKRPKKPPAPAQLRITAEPANIVADGETKSVITLQLLDKKGTPITAIADTQVKISAAKGKLENPTLVVPKGKDAEQTIIVSSRESGVVPVSAEADGLKGVTITLNFLEKKRYCMHCGAIMPSKAKSCQNCGKTPPAGVDTKVCHNCKSVIPIVAKFCSECGSSQKE
jgi:ribosomal protein L40E/plastocyanin